MESPRCRPRGPSRRSPRRLVARPPSLSRLSRRCPSTRELRRSRFLPTIPLPSSLTSLFFPHPPLLCHRPLCPDSTDRVSCRTQHSSRRRLPRSSPRTNSIPHSFPTLLLHDSCPLHFLPWSSPTRPRCRRTLRRCRHGYRRHHHGPQFPCHRRSVDRRKHQSRPLYRSLDEPYRGSARTPRPRSRNPRPRHPRSPCRRHLPRSPPLPRWNPRQTRRLPTRNPSRLQSFNFSLYPPGGSL